MKSRSTLTSLLSILGLTLSGCTAQSSSPTPSTAAPARPESCPQALPAPHLLPGSLPEHRNPGFWISKLDSPDALVLNPKQIEALNRHAMGLGDEQTGMGARYALLTGPDDPGPIGKQMSDGIARHRARAERGKRSTLDGSPIPLRFFSDIEAVQRSGDPAETFHLVTELTELRCHPTEVGLYEFAGDVDYDLLLCSTLRPGEVLRVVSRHRDGWLLVRTSYVAGWINSDSLGPEISREEMSRYFDWNPFVVVTTDRAPIWSTRERRRQIASVHVGLRLPLLKEWPGGLYTVMAPSSEGLREGFIDGSHVHDGYIPLTRRNVIIHAFARLDDTFGWAGAGGDRDCSRFLMDLFSLFGLTLPRNSAYQSLASGLAMETEGMSNIERKRALDRSLARGIPLVFMPGHIMLLLGRDGDHYHAIHQFSGYRVGCTPGHDVKMAVNRLSVTSLQLGEGSERTSFMDRFARITIIGSDTEVSSR